jgi:hypothetical protein
MTKTEQEVIIGADLEYSVLIPPWDKPLEEVSDEESAANSPHFAALEEAMFDAGVAWLKEHQPTWGLRTPWAGGGEYLP